MLVRMPTRTINAGLTGIRFHCSDDYHLGKHLVTGLNIIKPRNCYFCVMLNGFIDNTEDCNSLLVRINYC